MGEWYSAVVVALTGIISVFLVLGILQIVVTLTGKIFDAKLAARLNTKSGAKPSSQVYKEGAKAQV